MNIDYGLFILVSLAVHRVSYLLSYEEGPFGIMSWLRGKIDPNESTWLGRGLHCIRCISFWISLIGAAIAFPNQVVLMWLAIAGMIAIIEKVTYK